MVYQWLKNNLSEWSPQACVLCGQTTQQHALCPACIRDLPRLRAEICYQCGLPLDVTAIPGPCGHCQQHTPAYDRVISGFAYAQPISQLVAKLKFRGQIQLARLFGELLVIQIASLGSHAQAVLPVPLHPKRLRHRGFNQALEIARPVSRQLSLPILHDTVYRCRNTQPQAEQPAGWRAQNIQGAFELNKSVAYKQVAIVDDVMTSGHTVNEIAQLLRQAGVEQIEVWCVARAWPHHH
jgi:ComF family protein